MNRKLLYLLVSISSLVSIGIVSIFLFFIYRAEIKSVTQFSSNIHSAYLQEIIYNYKNDLVSGNYRSFRNQLASLIDHEIFSSYRLIQNGQNLDISEDFERKSKSNHFTKINIPIWFDEARTNKWGEVELLINTHSQAKFMSAFLAKLGSPLLLIFLIILLLVCVYAYFWQMLNFSLTKKVDQIFNGELESRTQVGLSIWQPMLDQLAKLKMSNDELNKENEMNRMHEILVQITRQVAHDIRSPLSALNIMVNNITEVSEEKRIIIRGAAKRINQIAEDLLSKGRNRNMDNIVIHNQAEGTKHDSITNVVAVINHIVTEKKVILGTDSNITFEIDFDEANDTIVNCNQGNLERIVSNLINNSIEAFATNVGTVSIRVARYAEQVILVIQDNGVGIPKEVLSKLGNLELTSGKENGNGLGIYHAKKSIEDTGGTFEIQSRLGIGTMITIKIPVLR